MYGRRSCTRSVCRPVSGGPRTFKLPKPAEVVYDLFNPERARTPDKDRLSYYLGKKSSG